MLSIIGVLSEHLHEDKSALVKKSLIELYEDVMELDEIRKFEAKEKKGRASLFTARDIPKI